MTIRELREELEDMTQENIVYIQSDYDRHELRKQDVQMRLNRLVLVFSKEAHND